MSLKPTRNNPNPIEFKKEIEMIQFKREPNDGNNNEKIIQLESENKLFIYSSFMCLILAEIMQ